jgi:hypothetical protein
MDLPHGGWVPKGRLAEDGPLPEKYKVGEMPTDSYPERTEQNVIDSDGTLIVSHGKLTGGSKLTEELADKHQRPCLHIDLDETTVMQAAHKIIDWTLKSRVEILNVAGPKENKDPLIYMSVYDLLHTIYYLAITEEPVVEIRDTYNAKTVDDAVKLLLDNIPLKLKSDMAKMDEGDLIDLHFTFGAFIRNEFGLWKDNKELMDDCSRIAMEKDLQPDQASSVIIKELWKRLRETHKLRVVK